MHLHPQTKACALYLTSHACTSLIEPCIACAEIRAYGAYSFLKLQFCLPRLLFNTHSNQEPEIRLFHFGFL